MTMKSGQPKLFQTYRSRKPEHGRAICLCIYVEGAKPASRRTGCRGCLVTQCKASPRNLSSGTLPMTRARAASTHLDILERHTRGWRMGGLARLAGDVRARVGGVRVGGNTRPCGAWC